MPIAANSTARSANALDPASPAQVGDADRRLRIGDESFGHAECARILRQRHQRRDGTRRLQLRDEQGPEGRVQPRSEAQCAQTDGLDDQRAQQRVHTADGAGGRQFSCDPVTEVQGSHRNGAGHANAMRRPDRNPYRELRRNEPVSAGRGDLHQPAGCEHQPIGPVRVLRHVGVGRVFAGDPVACRPMPAPGIGPVTALSYRATLDRVERFADAGRATAYPDDRHHERE